MHNIRQQCNKKVVAFEDWMVSREQPEGVSAVIMGREWTSPRTGAGSTGSTGAVSSQLIQDHPELLVTEVDLEEDRDREDYISVMKAQKAKDEAINADSVIGSAATTSNTTSNTASVASKDKASATARENDSTATSTSTSISADSGSLSAAVEHQSTDRMSDSSNAQQHNKSSPSKLLRQIGEEKGERGERGREGGREGGEDSDASKLKITLTLPSKTENTSLQSNETRERTFPGNILLSSSASHNDDQNDMLQLQIKEEIKNEGEMAMEIVDDSSIPVSTFSLSSTPLTTSQSLSQSQYTESESAASAVLQVEVEVKNEVKDGVTDEAEALRKAFEDASDSDDDDDEDGGGGGGGDDDVGKGSAGGDVIMTGGNSDDEEEEEEEDGDEEEEVLEVGGGAVVMEGQGQGVRRSEEIGESDKMTIDMNTSARVTETEGGTGAGVGDGEEEANEDDDDDEEDWMKDV